MLTISSYTFQGPFDSVDLLQGDSGVYAVVTDDAGSWKLLDCGECGNLKDQLTNHERQSCWQEHAFGKIAFAAKYCDLRGRQLIACEIRQEHQLPCG